jgi:hypothetical protein
MHLHARVETRRVPTIGGVAAWRLPALAAGLGLGALAVGEWALVCGLAMLGAIATSLDRSTVIELSRTGLARGFTLRGAFLGHARVVPWSAISEVSTIWRAPRDYSVLETFVSTGDGVTIRFSSRMGFAAYRALIEEIVQRAPVARRTGLTEQVLAERHRPLRTRRRVALGATFVVLAGLLLAAVV